MHDIQSVTEKVSFNHQVALHQAAEMKSSRTEVKINELTKADAKGFPMIDLDGFMTVLLSNYACNQAGGARVLHFVIGTGA